MGRHRSPFGATGRFPEGKLHPDDEGELRFGVAHKDGHVVVSFGTPVTWIGMGASDARELAKSLIAHADAIEDPGAHLGATEKS